MGKAALFAKIGCIFLIQLGIFSQVLAAPTISIERVARLRNFKPQNPLPVDIQDNDIYSPKSVRFSADGRKFYVNSLEGAKTVVYSWPDLKKLKVIQHKFDAHNQELFQGLETIFEYPFYVKPADGKVNHFLGKPVESELSHKGRYLWVPYYRRSYDTSAQSPSAVAIIDTDRDEIVRVMPTGPIPKYVVASPDGKYMAVIHWGDNTVGLIDISSSSAANFQYVAHIVVEKQMSQEGVAGTDRDKTCGFCLRGSVFTPDSRYLFMARISGGGGISAIDIAARKYMGTVLNVPPTPRHLSLSNDGQTMYVTSNKSGFLSEISLNKLLAEMTSLNGKRSGKVIVERSIDLGAGARTVDLSPDGSLAFVALNDSAKIGIVSTATFEPISFVEADPFPVGLAVSPAGDGFIVTSQGHANVGGGNAVNVYRY